jgi:O-antigen/teichoic acid export membrane protein
VRARGLRENSLLALSGDSASKLGAFIVIVLSARLLSIEEFAVLAAGLAAAGVIGSLLDLGSGTVITRDGARTRVGRGALFGGLLRARVPIAIAVLLAAPLVGIAIGRPLAALGVVALGIVGSLAVSVNALYRSCQDLRPEAFQRLAAAVLSVVAALVVGLLAPRADLLLATLAALTLATLVPLVVLAPRVADFEGGIAPRAALRLAAPIGLLALATIAYYRSGTLVLAALADARETAMFGVAASIAFGMLMIPNAVTTALLPRLAVEGDGDRLVAQTRRALAVTFLAAALLSAAAAAVVPAGLPLVLGPEYRAAGLPFALLCVGVPLIAASGVVGTALLSIGRLRPLGVQVAASLAVNLLALVLLAPSLGAVGAALATVGCEAVGLVLLSIAARTALPGLFAGRAEGVRHARPVPS